jgi:hypothetical protein
MQQLPMFLSIRAFARFPRFDDMPGEASQPRGQKLFKVTRAFLPIERMDASRNDRSCQCFSEYPDRSGSDAS